MNKPPQFDPLTRDADDITDAADYAAGDRVWMHLASRWHPGVVLFAGAGHATIRYQLPGQDGGTAVETRPAQFLARRTSTVPVLDTPEKGARS